jgi:hypothetical protein
MKTSTSIIYIAIICSNNETNIICDIDLNYFIEHGTYLLNSAYQECSNIISEGSNIISNAILHGSNIQIPKSTLAFDISKSTFLDLSNTGLYNPLNTWEKIVSKPRPIFYHGIPWPIVFDAINSKFDIKSSLDLIYNNDYINSMICNFQTNFSTFMLPFRQLVPVPDQGLGYHEALRYLGMSPVRLIDEWGSNNTGEMFREL